MVFASITFLFLFLPGVLALHFLLPTRARNLLLLVASLLFYAWGEVWYVLLMVGSIAANTLFGLLVSRARGERWRRIALACAVVVNLGLLASFKYANFLVDTLNAVISETGLWVSLAPVHLPIGISFFTFHAISYVVDVYRGQAEPQKDPFKVALYISLFPQLIAGPIIRYRDIAGQLGRRAVTVDDFAQGVRQFIVGLGKKVLIANVVARTADAIFAIPQSELTSGLAWLGVSCYTIQIFFDFSGYSDMALGLGRMFGFHFLPNFNYPYISSSIREFWRRWHISLSNWFRDYVYISLGGNRCPPGRVYLNLVVVFFLCGLWHGASWTFVIWGLYHGCFLAAERAGLERKLGLVWSPIRHLYALVVVMAGWALFRSGSLSYGLALLSAMAGFAPGTGVEYHAGLYLNWEVGLALAAGVIGSAPVVPAVSQWLSGLAARRAGKARVLVDAGLAAAGVVALVLVLAACATWLAAGTYNPFIYFRF
jgi:alginate O-acetyltransferase complex protein AlgI